MKLDVFPPASSLCCTVMSGAGPTDALQGTFWWGYGEAPATAAGTAEAILRELHRVLGEPPPALAAAPPAQAVPPPAHVAPSTVAALERHGELLDDPALRLAAASGSAYPDLVRRRRGEPVATPDLVLRPRGAESVAALVAACAEHDVALVPRGGGTSLSGGVDADDRGGCATLCVLDLRSVARVIDVDPVSRRVIAEPGVSGPELEQALRGLGLEVPHHPESFRRSTVGGWVATGALGSLLRGAHLATPVGIIETGEGRRHPAARTCSRPQPAAKAHSAS